MGAITVRKIDDEVMQRLRRRAMANKRSLEAEVRHLLAEHSRDHGSIIDDLEAFQAELATAYGRLSDSTPIIRKMREEA
jgi:plasmid stability protein